MCDWGGAIGASMMLRMPAPSLSAHQIRALAVESETDPRTVQRVLRGQPVRDLQGTRIRRALAVRGLAPPADALIAEAS